MNKKIFSLFVSTFSYYIVVGLAFNFSIILRDNNISPLYIGFSDSFRRVCGLIFMIFIPFLTNRFKLINVAIFSISIYTISLLLMPFYVNYALWLFYISLFGSGMMAFMTFIDAVLNVITENEKRGSLNGILNIVILAGISLAPFISSFIGFKNYNIYVFCAILSIINIFVFKIIFKENLININKKNDVLIDKIIFTKELNFRKFLKENFMLYFSKIILEFITNSVSFFTVIYASKNTWTDKDGSLLFSVYCFSGLIASWFTGWCFDKFKNYDHQLLVGSTLITIIFTSIIPLFINIHIISYIIYAVLGASTGFIYLGCLSILNGKYKKEELVSANTTLSIVGGATMVVSGVVVGYSMEKFNNMILPMLFLGIIYIILLLIKGKNVQVKR
jgi:MFS family permease